MGLLLLKRPFLCFILFVLSLEAQAWQEWRTIFLEGSPEEEQRLAALLLKSGMTGVLCKSLAMVDFHDFSRYESISVSQIADRLHPTDPRLDPFLLSVHRLFESKHYGHWVYVQEERWNQGFDRWLTDHQFRWHNTGTKISERPFYHLFLALLCYVAFLVILLFLVRRLLFPWLLGIGVLGFIFLYLGGESGLVGLYAAVIYFMKYLDYTRTKLEKMNQKVKQSVETFPKFWNFLLVLGFLSIVFISSDRIFVQVSAYLLFILAGWGLIQGAKAFWKKQLSELEHHLFLPFELRRAKGWRDRQFLRLILAASTALPVVFLSQSEQVELFSPWVIEKLDQPPPLQEAFEWELQNQVPGPRLYLAHLIYQETYPYGGEFGQVDLAPFYLYKYRRAEGRILETKELILPLNESWLDQAKNRTGSQGVFNLIGVGNLPYLLKPTNEVRLMSAPSPGSLFGLIALIAFIVLSNPQAHLVGRRRSFESHQRRQAA